MMVSGRRAQDRHRVFADIKLFADTKRFDRIMRELYPEDARAIVDTGLKLMIVAGPSLRRLRRTIDRRRHPRAVRSAGRQRGPRSIRAIDQNTRNAALHRFALSWPDDGALPGQSCVAPAARQ
jgi:hypothetical protein